MIVLEIFKEITSIPRCSKRYEEFIRYIKEKASLYDYICEVDSANNILCYKDNQTPTICLQSHYDIVCLRDDQIPTIIEQDGYLMAQDSTLGADNGIGCAYMIALMSEGYNCEFLFTSDEEIGLIGANGIELNLKSSYMLNLDSEELGEICIGCAGGVDIIATNSKSTYVSNDDKKELYEIEISGLDGGHSGVDIDKNIPNSIKLLVHILKQHDAILLDINAGERINSIPVYAKAIVVSSKPIVSNSKYVKVIKTISITQHYKKLDDNILNFLYTFANGVRGYDKELGVVSTSINLAMAKNKIDCIEVSLSARAMDNEELKILQDETVSLLKQFGFEVKLYGKYPAWKPIHSEFTQKVLHSYKTIVPDVNLSAIHAGLECAIFKDKFPHMQICSIGPNIYFPHSKNEKCEISSVIKIYDVIKEVLKTI